jgi:DNA-binding CsgD family transcriptional regulator
MNDILLENSRQLTAGKFIDCIARRKYYLGDKFPEIYLTQREAECVFWIIRGLTNKEVADKMQLSSRTIEYYLRNVRTKLNCYSKSHLIRVLQGAPFLSLIQDQVDLEER